MLLEKVGGIINTITENYTSKASRPNPFSAVILPVLGSVRRLIVFFTLTEEDRLKAGIYVGSKGHGG